jgi:glycogen synthase
MKVLLYSPAFLPQVGGLELNVENLAAHIQKAGHQVTVVTRTPSPEPDDLPFRVIRCPTLPELLREVRSCDVFHQANVSLRGLWPMLLVRRPWVVSHHSWYRRPDGRIAWQDRLKRFLLRFAAGSIAVSDAVAEDLPVRSLVIRNGYRDELFRMLPGVDRSGDLVALGRLVSDKGFDLLLEALALLAADGLAPRLTIVGDGPEGPGLREQAQNLGIAGQVEFLGTRTGEELVEILNRHRLLVVPSRYREPFGIVALEGIACGCVVVGSQGGGLPEAIGPCGRTFRNGDPEDLARVLAQVLRDPGIAEACRRAAPAHLASYRAAVVAARYCQAMAEAIRS